jgi:hypothetical protein
MAILKNVDGALQGLRSAGVSAARAAVQRNLPQVVYDAQRLVNNSAVLSTLFGLSGGSIRDVVTPLLGNVSLEHIERVHALVHEIRMARKNLWYVSVTDNNPPPAAPGLPRETPLGLINMLAVDLSYSPFTLKGDKVDMGSAVFDRLNGKESVELSMTVFDDEVGTIKRWFEGKCKQAANSDGTFGLPVEYCVNIEVVHAIAAPEAAANGTPYRSLVMMRPQAIQFDMSRREQALQELQLSFTEFDTHLSGGTGIA